MANPTIAKIRKLTTLGALGSFPPPSAPEFRRYNLIYGFNGSGKTTLSRVFASLEAGAPSPDLPEGGQFEVELTDGSVLKSGGDLSALSGRVLVFNSDFQERNLQWKAGTARPVFIIGEQQAEHVKALEKTIALKQQAIRKLGEARRIHQQAVTRFDTHKRDAARDIADAFGLGRRYNATNLESDQRSRPKEVTLLDEGEVKRLQSVIGQESPLSKLTTFAAPDLGLLQLTSDIAQALSETIGELKLQDFNTHQEMLGWAATGLNYHRRAALQHCLFCGGELKDDRMQELAEVINNRFARFTSEVKTLRDRVEAASKTYDAWSLPSPNDLSPAVRQRFTELARRAQDQIAKLKLVASELRNGLESKVASPNTSLSLALSLDTEAVATLTAEMLDAVAAINRVIEDHNKESDAFSINKQEALERLKNHYLDRGGEVFRSLGAEVGSEKAKVDALQSEQTRLEEEEERLQREVRSHGPAADLISRALQAYLGRSDLDISPVDNGYQLRRGGKPVRGSLSEGEKTAIALCYFLSTIQAERRKLKDLIVVIDDPVSSLDTRSLNYSFNVVRSSVGEAAQLFVLTHNLTYMNQVKKWLKPKTRPRDDGRPPMATLLFLESKRGASGGAATSIVELPKHIRDYDSEYHYLFNLVRQIAADPTEIGGYIYVMPNALRKVLEIFLAFKLPGADGLGSKVDALAKNSAYGLDPARVRALDTLVQVESHADDLEDLVSFSSMTVEEIRDAADALLHLMEKLDTEHYQRLCRACN